MSDARITSVNVEVLDLVVQMYIQSANEEYGKCHTAGSPWRKPVQIVPLLQTNKQVKELALRHLYRHLEIDSPTAFHDFLTKPHVSSYLLVREVVIGRWALQLPQHVRGVLLAQLRSRLIKQFGGTENDKWNMDDKKGRNVPVLKAEAVVTGLTVRDYLDIQQVFHVKSVTLYADQASSGATPLNSLNPLLAEDVTIKAQTVSLDDCRLFETVTTDGISKSLPHIRSLLIIGASSSLDPEAQAAIRFLRLVLLIPTIQTITYICPPAQFLANNIVDTLLGGRLRVKSCGGDESPLRDYMVRAFRKTASDDKSTTKTLEGLFDHLYPY